MSRLLAPSRVREEQPGDPGSFFRARLAAAGAASLPFAFWGRVPAHHSTQPRAFRGVPALAKVISACVPGAVAAPSFVLLLCRYLGRAPEARGASHRLQLPARALARRGEEKPSSEINCVLVLSEPEPFP